jgi:hypothetical protein
MLNPINNQRVNYGRFGSKRFQITSKLARDSEF